MLVDGGEDLGRCEDLRCGGQGFDQDHGGFGVEVVVEDLGFDCVLLVEMTLAIWQWERGEALQWLVRMYFLEKGENDALKEHKTGAFSE